jgi:C1A family cysteine protease
MGNYLTTSSTSSPKYNWCPDLPDPRDKVLKFPRIKQDAPIKVDLRDKLPPVDDQDTLSSSAAHAISTTYKYLINESSSHIDKDFIPSRLFLFFNQNKLIGSTIRNTLKSLRNFGVCSEKSWPYDISKSLIEPPKLCYNEALENKSVEYHRVIQFTNQLRQCLAMGNPIIFGLTIFESFESPLVAKTGMVPMPAENEKILGGQIVLLVGYDQEESYWICRNSWGSTWGDEGYFYLPNEYLAKEKRYTSDFWILKLLPKTEPEK